MADLRLPKVFAHRGGRQWAPENTLAAFRASLQAGVDGVELDIQRCASGELVVFHDEDIGRTTDGVGLVKDISYPELKRVGAGSWFDPAFKNEYVPLLQEVLDLVAGQLVINIEIKNTPIEYPGIEEDLLDLLSGYDYGDKIIISSFDHQVLRNIHSHDASWRLAILGNNLFAGLAEYAQKVGAHDWNPQFGCLRPEVVAEAHAAGLQVNPWTVNEKRHWSQALQMSVDSIITDDPGGLQLFLDQVQAASSS